MLRVLICVATLTRFQAKETKAKDYEDFLDDLVEDFEVRAKINMFKDPEGLAQAAAAKADRQGAMGGGDEADDDAPEVSSMIVIMCHVRWFQ